MASQPGQMFGVTVGLTSVLCLGPSEKRRSVIFFPPQTGRVTLGTTSNIAVDVGPTLTPNGGPIVLTWDQTGDVIRGQIWAIADAANRNVGIVESLDL